MKQVFYLSLRCTVEKLKDDGVYLLDNGMHMLFYVGITVNPAFIQVRKVTLDLCNQ